MHFELVKCTYPHVNQTAINNYSYRICHDEFLLDEFGEILTEEFQKFAVLSFQICSSIFSIEHSVYFYIFGLYVKL